jgi:hypothetical protein
MLELSVALRGVSPKAQAAIRIQEPSITASGWENN